MAQYRLGGLILSATLLVFLLNVAEYKAVGMELPHANQTSAAMMAEDMSPEEVERQGGGNVIYITISIVVNNGGSCSTAGNCGGMSNTCNSRCDSMGYHHYRCLNRYCKCCTNNSGC